MFHPVLQCSPPPPPSLMCLHQSCFGVFLSSYFFSPSLFFPFSLRSFHELCPFARNLFAFSPCVCVAGDGMDLFIVVTLAAWSLKAALPSRAENSGKVSSFLFTFGALFTLWGVFFKHFCKTSLPGEAEEERAEEGAGLGKEREVFRPSKASSGDTCHVALCCVAQKS